MTTSDRDGVSNGLEIKPADWPAMARPLRIEFPHALYYVTSRGHARQRIVTTDADRQAWLAVLGQVIGRFGWGSAMPTVSWTTTIIS